MSSRENLFTYPASPAPKVLIVDDHVAMRDGLTRLLKAAPMAWGEVVAVGTLEEARSAAARLSPRLVLLDVDLAGDDGLTLLPELALTSRVLVLTSHGDALTRERALRLGAVGLFDKQDPAERLLAQIGRIAAPRFEGGSGSHRDRELSPMFGPTHLAKVHSMDSTTTLTTVTKRMRKALQSWWEDEAGVTAIEYGLLAALIVVVAIGAIGLTGTSLNDVYTKWTNAVIDAISGS